MSGGQEALAEELRTAKLVEDGEAGASAGSPPAEGTGAGIAEGATGEGATGGGGMAEEKGEGTTSQEGTEPSEVSSTEVSSSSETSESAVIEASDLERYSALQKNISELQGLQVAVELMHARQQAASLEQQLAAARAQTDETRKALAKKEAEYNKLSADKWYPGKKLVRAVAKDRYKHKLEASEEALEELSEELPKQEARVKELEGKVDEAHCWIDAWQGKDQELASAQRAAAELERQISRLWSGHSLPRLPSFGGGGRGGASLQAPVAAAAAGVPGLARKPSQLDRAVGLEARLEEVQQLTEKAQQDLEAEQDKYLGLAANKWYPGKVVLDLATNQRFTEKKIEHSKARLEADKEALDVLEAEAAELASQLEAADSSTCISFRHGSKAELVDVLCALEGSASQEAPESEGLEHGRELAAQVLQVLRRVGQLRRKLASARRRVESCRRAVLQAQQGCDKLDKYYFGKFLQFKKKREAKKATSQEALAFFQDQLLEYEERVKDLEGQLAEARQSDELLDLVCSMEEGSEPDLEKSVPERRQAGAAGKLVQAIKRNRHRQRCALRKTLNGLHFQSADIKNSFPEAANTWNVALDVPLTAYMFPYNSKFLGPLQKLQIGPILHAYYRFGPLGCDPKRVDRSTHGSSSNGSSEGRLPLFLLSGLGSTMISWGVPLLRALACNHEVVIMEYRGAGLSTNSGDEPWNYYNQAQAMIDLADALGIPKFNLLGWSSGGNTGMVLAALHGDRVGKVASMAGVAGGSNTIVPPEYEYLNPDLSLSVGQTMALIFPPDEPDFAKVCGEYIKAVFSMPGAITDQTVGKRAAAEQWASDKEFTSHDERVWDALPNVKVPVLLMNGTKDALVPPANAERLAARIPGAQLRLFPGWGHAFKDVPKFVEVINAFLLDNGPAPSSNSAAA